MGPRPKVEYAEAHRSRYKNAKREKNTYWMNAAPFDNTAT
jgi:hypothetical protein